MKNLWIKTREDQYDVYVGCRKGTWDLFKSTSTIQEARKALVFITDTPYWIICKIVHQGNIVRETTGNEFYYASNSVIEKFIANG